MDNYQDEYLYIAGPECFYKNGYELWWAQRKLAEYYGIKVVIPTSTPLKLDNPDLRQNAREIFDDLIVQMNKATAIIADLEFFRGSEPDGGTVFEMGWLWFLNGRLYGYTRDARTMAEKNQTACLKNNIVVDKDEKQLAYWNLSFCPSVVASSKIIEGTFHDALKIYMLDLDEERKTGLRNPIGSRKVNRKNKRVYIASSKRYDSDYRNYCSSVENEYKNSGYEAVFPIDGNTIFDEDPLRNARIVFDKNMELLLSCSTIAADLNNYHGFEPNNDVSFECGVAYGAGLRCYGYMEDTRIMQERIPHYDTETNKRDWAGNIVENFNLPINLMFSSYFTIVNGTAKTIIPVLE